MENDTIKCADCHCDLSEIKVENIIPCPNCGSQRRILEASTHEGFKIYDSLSGEAKNSNYTGKRKWRWDWIKGKCNSLISEKLWRDKWRKGVTG